MKAMYFEEFGARPEIRNVNDPAPGADGVVIRVEASGICRSDWHGWCGHDSDVHLPHVPGHEFAGTILAVGRNVRRLREGMRVTVPFVSGCGHCEECFSGNQQVCSHQFQPGFTHWGSFAEYVAVDYADTNVVELPDDVDFAAAASLGCRFATSFRAVVDQGRIRSGEWVAVHGAGGVGLSAIMIASAMGAQVVAVDISAEKLAFAKGFGAVHGVNASEVGDVASAIIDLTGGGAHLSIDALGHRDTWRNSILNLRRRGRHVQVGLMAGAHADPQTPVGRIIAYELEVLGSHGMQAWRYSDMLAMVRSGKVDPRRLIGKTVDLEAAIDVLVGLDRSQDIGMAIIDRFD